MKAYILHRIASILILLFAAGHTIEFRKIDPAWGVDPLIASMQLNRFYAQGFSRTYYDFFVGFGLFVSLLLVFAALLAWQLGGLSAETLGSMRLTTWAFAFCFVGLTFLSWRYFFVAPIIFSALISVCLIAAAWLATKSTI